MNDTHTPSGPTPTGSTPEDPAAPADDAIVAELAGHLRARHRLLDLPDGSVDDVTRRAARRQRNRRAGRGIGAVAVAASVVFGAMIITGPGDDDPRTSIDVAGPPAVVGDPEPLVLTRIETTGMDGDVYDVVVARDGYYAVDTGFSPDDQVPTTPPQTTLLHSTDGTAWTPVMLPVEPDDRVSRVLARDDTVVVVADVLPTDGDQADGPAGAVVFVRRSAAGEWARIPVASTYGVDAGILGDGSVYASVYEPSAAERSSSQASNRLQSAIAERFPEADGHGWSFDDGVDPLDVVVEVTKGSDRLGSITFEELGIDEADARVLVQSGGFEQGRTSLFRIEGATAVPVTVPEPTDASPGQGRYVTFVGDTIIVSDGGGRGDWLLADGTWVETPAAFGTDSINTVASSSLGVFASLNGAGPSLYRADDMAGPWVEVDLGDEPDQGFGALTMSDDRIWFVVQDFGDGMQAPATSVPLTDADEPAEPVADAHVVIDTDGVLVDLDLASGAVVVRDHDGTVLAEYDAGELDVGSDRVAVEQGAVSLTLPDGRVVEVDREDVEAAIREQRPEMAVGTESGTSSVSVSSGAEHSPVRSVVTVFTSTDGHTFHERTTDAQFSSAIAGSPALVLAVAEGSEAGGTGSTFDLFRIEP